ncbi:MAG TPA: hypothetical protein VII39_09780 [Bradyrhizobium sp.]
MPDPDRPIPELWNFIPTPWRPYPDDLNELDQVNDWVIEGVKLRHDFQRAAATESHERQLGHAASLSGFAQARRSAGVPATAKDIANQYTLLINLIKPKLFKLENKALMEFAFKNLKVVMPDIGLDEKNRPLLRIGKGDADQNSFLRFLRPGRVDILVGMLLGKSYYW